MRRTPAGPNQTALWTRAELLNVLTCRAPHVPQATATGGQPRSTPVKTKITRRHEKTALTCVKAVLTRVARAGVEPATFRFSGGRSYQLSYLAGNAGGLPDVLRP